MRRFLICYWIETGDDKDNFDEIVEANSIQEALTEFTNKKRLAKVESIERLNKTDFVISKRVGYSVLENVFVTVMESGFSSWFLLTKKSRDLVRSVVSKEEDPFLSTAMLKAVIYHNIKLTIYDSESDDEVIGELSNETIQSRLSDLNNDIGLSWALENELSESGDAESSDVVFQFLTMGEYVFG